MVFETLRRAQDMHMFTELDVTLLRERMRSEGSDGQPASLFAYVLKALAAALAGFPRLNSIRQGRTVYEYDDVDVCFPMELDDDGSMLARNVTIRSVQSKSPAEIDAEVQAIRETDRSAGHASTTDRARFRAARFVLLFPRLLRTLGMRTVFHRARYIKRTIGTVFVSSIMSRDSTLTYGFTPMPEMCTVKLFLGTVTSQTAGAAANGGPEQPSGKRDLLALTVMVDHKVVDGAEAMRFVKRLKSAVERGEV